MPTCNRRGCQRYAKGERERADLAAAELGRTRDRLDATEKQVRPAWSQLPARPPSCPAPAPPCLTKPYQAGTKPVPSGTKRYQTGVQLLDARVELEELKVDLENSEERQREVCTPLGITVRITRAKCAACASDLPQCDL